MRLTGSQQLLGSHKLVGLQGGEVVEELRNHSVTALPSSWHTRRALSQRCWGATGRASCLREETAGLAKELAS